MNKKRLIAGVAISVALLAGAAQAADEQAYTEACAAAEAARKTAAEMRYEWNTVAPLIEKAGEAAAAGDYAKGVKLCDEARKHSEASIAQAKHESEAWKAAVVR